MMGNSSVFEKSVIEIVLLIDTRHCLGMFQSIVGMRKLHATQ